MTTQVLDRKWAEAFAGRMIGVLNDGALALMTSIGHRTGLFDTMAKLPPSTSEEIASAANLDERYVREWLAAMTVGRIAEYDPEDGKYSLFPPSTQPSSPEALRPDGVYLMQDIAGSSHLHNNMDHPLGPFLYTVSTMHCTTVSLAQSGEGLGTMWGEEKAREMLREAGFEKVEVKQLSHDIANRYFIARKA